MLLEFRITPAGLSGGLLRRSAYGTLTDERVDIVFRIAMLGQNFAAVLTEQRSGLIDCAWGPGEFYR